MEKKLNLDCSKVRHHKERIHAWLKGEKIVPITIDCSLSSDCNYNCVYCYGKLQRMHTGSWSRDMIISFLDDAAELGVKAISLVSDGESTCNPHFVEAILHGREKGIDMALGTNGFLLDKDKLEKILPALTYLRFNISSGTPEGYCQIHGVNEKCYHRVLNNIREAVSIKKRNNLPVTIGLQMVLMPQFGNEILPLANLGRELGVDYLVIKHCSDDEDGNLGVEYKKYADIEEELKKAEALSTPEYSVQVKWSKIRAGNKRSYSHCYGSAFIMQLSGSGLVAPCGMLFNDKYSKYHIGNLKTHRFKEIFESDKYMEVMDMLANSEFDARTDCGFLCLQHKTNEVLNELKKNRESIDLLEDKQELETPPHVNFI